MTTILYAQPYDISASGFPFQTADAFAAKAAGLRNDHGDAVEEFEIQFIDGEAIDAALALALGLSQATHGAFFSCVETWEYHEKVRYIIAVGECGVSFDLERDDIDLLDVDIYEEASLRDIAMRFVEDGLFGDIPEQLQSYIDYDAIARDLSIDYAETEVAGDRIIYRCG